MSNMCLVVTPAIEELASKIQQEYPEACQRNGFNNQMCAEWIGLYNNTNSKNPDNVPAMKSLVNFIEKLRNQEGKSFLRDLRDEERQRATEQEMQEIKARAQADGTFMKAPNGKDTNLTERQWLQVRTKNFINWFGDWINDPTNASKVIDGNGEPLVVYHGSPYFGFTIFSKNSPDRFDRTTQGLDKKFYFTKDRINSRQFALNDEELQALSLTDPEEGEYYDIDINGNMLDSRIYPVFLNIRKPVYIDANGEAVYQLSDKERKEIDNSEGAIIENALEQLPPRILELMPEADDYLLHPHTTDYLVSNPNQIKSATDNNGMFSTENPDIQMAVGNTAVTPSQESQYATQQLIDHLKFMGIPVHNREEMIQYLNEHGYNSIQEAIKKNFSRHTKNDVSAFHLSRNLYEVSNDIFSIDSEKKYKREIQSFIKGLSEDTDRTSGIWYLSKDGKRAFRINASIENFEENKKETTFGFEVVDWYNLEELSVEQYKNAEYEYKQDARILGSLFAQYESEQGSLYNSDGLFANGETNRNNVGLGQEALSREPNRGGNTASSRINQGESEISSFFLTPQGEVFGFVAPNGDIYLDETVISPEHPIHEYTHLWDRALAKNNPELWQRGVELMKNLALWKEIEDSDNYGKKWKALNGMTDSKLEGLIASEVHARLVGENGEKLLNQIAEEKGNKGIIDKLKQWILDAWKDLKATFGNWSQEEIDKLTLKDFNHMTVRDFADGINPSSISSPSQAAQNTSQPNTRPQSDSFKTALKVTENRTTQFYQTFTPQQIKDRGVMIADYFSDIIDDYILDELDRVNEIIENPESSGENKEDARTLKNLLRDPVNGRQYAANKIQIGNILNQIKDKIRRNANSHEGAKKQLWQNTLDFFDELFNNQASLEIEEQEGIRIIGLKTIEKSPDDVANEEENDGNDETGHIVSGNDGWIFQTRFENPASSLSKRVRRMTYNIRRSASDKDDLGHTRKYPSGQIYATLLSYLAKNMQNPDDFMQVIKPEEYDGIYDHYGNEVTEDLYPYGYPTFPVLETMRSQYPWVEQIINRLTDDYLDKDWNTCIAFPSTYGAMASQFYTNFRKVFIPYAKIQVGDGKFGVTPLNTEMEARCQKDKLAANFNNGIVMTDTCIYNQDTTINREHADDLKDYINDVIEDGGVEHAYRLYQDLSDPDSVTEQEDVDDFNLFTDRVVFLLNSFGISSNRDNVVALLAQTEQGKTLLDMLKDLHYVADTISKVSDENAQNYNYLLDLHYVGGESVWGKFFEGRGMITDESYMQSFYDSASKKTRYSYSADNYLQKTFRGLYNPDLDERREFIEQNFMKYEWFYNHNTNTWRNKWLEHLYNAQDISDTLPYRNINNITEYGETTKVRDYRTWTPTDVWLVQNRSFDSTKPYTFYLAPIFSDSPMSMTVKGPILSNEEVLNALVGLVDQEMWRIKYVGEREAAIERGDVKPIANFDGKRGKEFCFIPELNSFTFENGETFLQRITRMKNGRAEDGSEAAYNKADFDNVEKQALLSIMAQKADAYLAENRDQYDMENFNYDEFLRNYMNMVYANASIIQFSTIDLAFYKSDVDFQKRFKEVYAGGIQLNTNSRYGKKTENTILLADDKITSPSYNTIKAIIENNENLSKKDKERILSAFTDINVADAQAIRSMHSFRSVMDMMGRWDDKAEEALEHFDKGDWGKEDFDTIFQTIKPFVYTVIDRNDGNGGVIPVPQQHKNSEICALMMYDLITNDLNSPVYKALSKFMETKDSNGDYLIDMIQFESAGKVGNQGVINISFNPKKVMDILNNEKYDFVADAPNTLENAETNYKAIKKQMDKKLVGEKITQEEYDKVMQSLRPTEEEIISILEQTALIKDADGNTSINPEVVHTIPFDNYYQAQPTPAHHVDVEATFGSQARNIAVADLPDDFTLTVKTKGGYHIFKGKDALVDFYYELLDENLIEGFYGDGREGSRNKDGLKGIFSSKESLMEAVTDIVRGNPKYGKDFVDALRTDSDGNFTISPNSPTMFTLMQELITSLFKNRITKQKINGAALIQAAGIGLDNELRLIKDSKGNVIGAECLMPLTSENFFRPLLKTDEEGRKYFDVNDLPEDLRKAVGYRIPTENKSSMLPLYIKGFTPQQNGSAIILPAEITTLAGSDFDVDKMFIMLSEFYIQNFDMEEARKAWAEEESLNTDVFSNPSLDDELSEADPEAFMEWFKENKNKFRWTNKGERPKIKRVEYNWNLTPKQNGRKARNNMIIQMIYGILTSKAGNQSLLNPQGFDNLKSAAKLNRIIKDPVLAAHLLQTYKDADAAADAVLGFSLGQREDFIKDYSSPDAPIYPQTFAHSHAKNMAGSNQIGIYAIQASMAAKYQRADITLKEFQRFTVNGRVIKDVDVSDNGKRLKNCGEMIGASADNGKDPNLSDAGSTSKTAPIIGYMLRLGLTHEEAVLIINQPIMVESDFSVDTMEKNYPSNIRMLHPGEVNTKTLVKAILDPESIDSNEQQAIDAMCYRILKQSKAMEGLTMISRADSPNGAMQNSFAKARIQQYMVERFNAEMRQPDFPFYPIREVINNNAIKVSEGENAVREKLKAQPMAFLHAMYGLGINSLNDLASPYFFMLRKNFDDAIVKPILYNQSSTSRDHLEELVNNIYVDYITYSLSASPLFGEEDNENGEHASMKSKMEYYLNTFPDDFAKTLQENEEIRNLIGNILKREIIKDKYTGAVTKKIVLDDVGSLAKGQKDIISRRFDALLSSKEGQNLAKHLLLYAYYDSGLNFSHNSYSTRLSTYFLSQFPAFREILQQLDVPLTEEQQQNFIYQFLITHKNAAFNVDSIKDDKMKVGDDSIVVDFSSNSLRRKFTNTILSPDPRMTGVQPYPFISYNGNVYELDADAYARERNAARYYMLEEYPTSSRRPVYNINKSLSQLADEYLGTEEQQESGEINVDENTNPDIAHNSGSENPVVDNTDTQTSDTSEEFDFDNFFEVPASESENYENEGKSSLESPFC